MTDITILSLVAGVVGTGIGGLIGTFFSDKNDKCVSCVLNFAAGIMLAMVFLSLIPTALNQQSATDVRWVVLAGVAVGGTVIYLLGKLINDANTGLRDKNKAYEQKGYLKSGIVLFLAIGLHNIPEGLALGCFGAIDKGNAIVFASLLALHNLPEGMAISLPLKKGGKSRLKSFVASVAGGATTVGGAIVGFLAGNVAPVTNSFFLSVAAGAMLSVTFSEIIPQALKNADDAASSIFVFIGTLTGAIFIFFL